MGDQRQTEKQSSFKPFFIFLFTLFSSIRYHGSSSSIKFRVYHHVGGRRLTPVVCNESREPHTSHYPSRPVTKKKQPTNYSYQPLCSRPVEFSKAVIKVLDMNVCGELLLVAFFGKIIQNRFFEFTIC